MAFYITNIILTINIQMTDFYKEEAMQRMRRIKNQQQMDSLYGTIYKAKENQKLAQSAVINLNDATNPVANALIKQTNKINEDPIENARKVLKFLESYASREDAQTIVEDYLDDEDNAFIVKTIPFYQKVCPSCRISVSHIIILVSLLYKKKT